MYRNVYISLSLSCTPPPRTYPTYQQHRCHRLLISSDWLLVGCCCGTFVVQRRLLNPLPPLSLPSFPRPFTFPITIPISWSVLFPPSSFRIAPSLRSEWPGASCRIQRDVCGQDIYIEKEKRYQRLPAHPPWLSCTAHEYMAHGNERSSQRTDVEEVKAGGGRGGGR